MNRNLKSVLYCAPVFHKVKVFALGQSASILATGFPALVVMVERMHTAGKGH